MQEAHETACYSIHAVGLVIDQRTRCVVVADPNAQLLEGGGMEFMKLPHEALRKGQKASTCVSQFDRDQMEPEPPPAKKKKKSKK